MKIVFIILLIIIYANAFSQTDSKAIIGRYKDYFGSSLELKDNSTFNYEWHFDMSSSWTKGIWRIEKDTIFFKVVIVYDTLILKNDSVSLIISNDAQSDKIYQAYNLNPYMVSGGQNYYTVPEKLYFRKGMLFYFRNGKIFKKRVKGFWSSKKFPSWYVREDK